jgi:hypothetical protein
VKRILVPIGCRSDEGLSAPVIKRLREYFDVHTIKLTPQDFRDSYSFTHDELNLSPVGKPYDLILITGDRVEMCAAAAAAFHNKVKIAHLYAGIVNDPVTTFDDVDRHCITLWSDIQMCESNEAMAEVVAMMYSFKDANAHVVGITHLDDLEVDESKVPLWPYDLVLYNFPPLSKENDELVDSAAKINEALNPGRCELRKIVLIGGNPDGLVCFPWLSQDYHYPSIPRPQFLGLLKNCQRFITNSSAAIYEAPHFLKPEQIVMVGDRNRNRPRGPFQTGASDRIVEILREYLK